MRLPNDSVGITDLIAYRECPRRMSYGMRRHTGHAEQSDAMTPESSVYGAAWARAYGSAIHDAIQALEEGETVEVAIQVAWKAHGALLEPADVELLRDDLATYVARDFPGTRTVLSEGEIRVPLMVHAGVQIYFRARIDRLYERLDAPGTFIHVDYKSSKHAKSDPEVHGDLQLWAYNWAIHEFFPEVERLHQIYDQLRYGQIPTRKSDQQREQIRDWLIVQTTAVLEDEDVRDDGLLAWSYNDWCAWCPVLESCGVVGHLTDWSLTRVAALAPRRPKLKKDGEPSKVMEDVPLEADRLPEYVAEMEQVRKASQVLERFDQSVKRLLKDLPDQQRAALGYELRARTNSVFTHEAKKVLHERLGDDFYDLVGVTKTQLTAMVDDELLRAWALGLADEVPGSTAVVPVRNR